MHNAEKEPLLQRIHSFRRWRNWVAFPLIIIGVLALAIPILPGLAIIFLGLTIIKPELAEKIKNDVTGYINRFKKTESARS